MLKKLLIPKFSLREFLEMMKLALLAAGLGGVYGIFHDQVTYSISPEYFTRLKYEQFDWLLQYLSWLPERAKVGCIGFLAVGSVGLGIGWFTARASLLGNGWAETRHTLFELLALSGFCSMLGGLLGWCYAKHQIATESYQFWIDCFSGYGIEDIPAFLQVAQIHAGGYLGGVVGGLLFGLLKWRQRESRGVGSKSKE